MASLVFGMNQSLDGYVDYMAFAPDAALFRHFIDEVGAAAGGVYGRVMYEIMRYWDDEQADWGPAERDFAQAWRNQPKWVVSRTLKSVGPNAVLVEGGEGDDGLATLVRDLKGRLDGRLEICGTQVAASLTDLGLVDEYRIYLHPVVTGGGTPFFRRARPPLSLLAHERIGEQAIRLTYVPA